MQWELTNVCVFTNVIIEIFTQNNITVHV